MMVMNDDALGIARSF